jgi:plastocyanin
MTLLIGARIRALAPTLAVFLTVTSASAQSAPTVTIKNFSFSPMEVSVPVGGSVTWKNVDGEPHTVTSVDGLFRSGALDTSDSFSFKFTKAGTYKYMCSIHPRMVGTITVK